MSQTLDKETRDILRDYLREIRSLPNEAAKRARFYALITELFPRSRAVSDYARGIEKLIRVRTAELRDKRATPMRITAMP